LVGRRRRRSIVIRSVCAVGKKDLASEKDIENRYQIEQLPPATQVLIVETSLSLKK
jgi:hypothetical protein|tara:strand:+ start:405 stop:572 length:168 start_codon:yes stop_codon:yes gene_type:complete